MMSEDMELQGIGAEIGGTRLATWTDQSDTKRGHAAKR